MLWRSSSLASKPTVYHAFFPIVNNKHNSPFIVNLSLFSPPCHITCVGFQDILKNNTFLQRKYMLQSALESHADAHRGLKRFECNICCKRFTHRAGLIRHMKLHSEDDPFSCEFCGKKFRDRTEQENHRRAHTGERPYMCDICGRTFHTRAVWLDHSR